MEAKDLKYWPLLRKLDGSDFRKVFMFGNTALILKNNGKIGGIGKNHNYLFGEYNDSSFYESFAALSTSTKFKDFTTNGDYVLAIDEQGFLYSWGSNEHGQLGRDGSRFSVCHVEKMFAVTIKEATCGSNFSCVLTKEGRVFEWGLYGFNELVLETQKEDDKLEETEENEIVTIHATKYYPIVLLESGKVCIPSFKRATNKCNLCLHVEKINAIEGGLENKKIKMVTSGKNHVFALTSDGEIFEWALLPVYGCNCNGPPKPNHLAENIGRIVKIWAATTHDVLVAVNTFGNIYSITWNASAMLPSVSKVNFSSALEYFAYLGLGVQGPVHDQRNVDINVEENADILNEWRGSFDEAFNNKEDSDIEFLVDGKIIYGHRTILSIQSSYLKAILKNDWKENSENNQVTIKEYTYATYLRFMKFLYIRKLEMSSHEDNLELLKLAHEYVEKPLLDLCKNMVIQGLTVKNAFLTYNVAHLLGLEDVRQACKTLIGRNLEEVILSEDFSNQDEALLVRCVRDMICTKNIIGEGENIEGK